MDCGRYGPVLCVGVGFALLGVLGYLTVSSALTARAASMVGRVSVGMVEQDIVATLGTPTERFGRGEDTSKRLTAEGITREAEGAVWFYAGAAPGLHAYVFLTPDHLVSCIYWVASDRRHTRDTTGARGGTD